MHVSGQYLWPACRSKNDEEALDVVNACGMIHIDPGAVQEVYSAFFNNPYREARD